MNGHKWAWRLATMGMMAISVGIAGAVFAQQDPEEPDQNGAQVLTQGPVHEAFAEPVVFDPKAAPVIPKQPPAPVEELPPSEKPTGANIQWIPGYWSWDEGRNDFIWVSGLWRDVPPGRHWVPGYWDQTSGGFLRVPGYWAPDEQTQSQYLSAPPASLESGPSGPAPSPEATWAPGNWYWQENRYVWSPGYWVPFQANWLWVPAHYIWTPGGYLFVNGYWDRPIANRGLMFAPVYFQQPLYSRPNYVYRPMVSIVAGAMMSSLFVRPMYNQYYFGDYYAPNYFQSGYYPSYAYHQSRWGYDPIYSHYATMNLRNNPRWLEQQQTQYRYMRDNPNARPARTYSQQMIVQRNITKNVQINKTVQVQNIVMGRPISQVASGGNSPFKFERLAETQRRNLMQESNQLGQFREQRLAREREVAKLQTKNPNTPRVVPLPRSPIVAARRAEQAKNLSAREHGADTPPARPAMPKAQPNVAAPRPGEAARRFDPHPDQLPPPAMRPGFAAPNNRPAPGATKAQTKGQTPGNTEQPRRPEQKKAGQLPPAAKAEMIRRVEQKKAAQGPPPGQRPGSANPQTKPGAPGQPPKNR